MNRKMKRTALGLTVAFLFGLTTVYPFLLYTDNSFVTKWRNIYIETAMSTMSHQWLATSFIPQEIIDEVVSSRYKTAEIQENVETNWSTVDLSRVQLPTEEKVNEADEIGRAHV